jgi:small subunit ribosomal protein S1
MSSEQEFASAVREEAAEHDAAPETQSAPGTSETQAASEGAAESSVPEVQIELPEVNPSPTETMDLDSLMMAEVEKASSLPTGEIVQGTVLKITASEVFVDVGLKTEAIVPLAEFQSEDGRVTVQPGETVGVLVESHNEKEGSVTLSRRKAARHELWERIETAFRDQTPLLGRAVERVKGGIAVDIGIKTFMPLSQADLRPLHHPESLMGQEIAVKVIKYARKRSNVVVSRRAVLEEEANARKAALAEQLVEGAELVGQVKNLTDYGAFVDLGGVDGLLHVTDMSWQRLKHPSEAVQVGQEIKVKVLKYDVEKGRVSLGLKQFLPDPWIETSQHFHAGDRIRGRVVSVTDYGAFVEVEPGIEGLIHVSEMSWSKRTVHPSKVVNKGDEVEVTVLDVKPEERRLSLSLRQTLPNPWNAFVERTTVGTEVDAVVRNLTDFGAFVEIEPGVEGLIHVSDLSWTKKIKHPSEVLKKGQKVRAVILRMEAEGQRISLGLKQLETDPWQDFIAMTKVGELVRGRVVRLAPFGAFVELREGVEGLCHNSEVNGGGKGEKKSALEPGQEYDFRILRISAGEKKIGLSRKEAERMTAPAQAPAAPAPRKPSMPMTTMAAAFSSAGITTSASSSDPAAPTADEAAPETSPQVVPQGD